MTNLSFKDIDKDHKRYKSYFSLISKVHDLPDVSVLAKVLQVGDKQPGLD